MTPTPHPALLPPPHPSSFLHVRYVSKGCWDSIHVVEVNEAESGKEATYKLTTTVMLSMSVDKAKLGNCNLAGSLSRQAKETAKFDKFDTHLTNVGQMIEKMETSLRKNLDGLYVFLRRGEWRREKRERERERRDVDECGVERTV